MTNKKNLLFITYFFPPLGGGGVQRILKFVKYLNKEKYNISILTVKPQFIKYTKDPSLIKDIPKEIKLFRVFVPDINWLYSALRKLRLRFFVRYLMYYIVLPDEKTMFFFFSRKLLENIIQNNKIDTVIISLPPFGLYKFASYIKRKFKIKIIADFRDLWTDNFSMIYNKLPAFKLMKETKFEKYLIKNSDYIITATNYMKSVLEQKYGITNIKTVTNGYDPDDFKGFQVENSDSLRFTYTGSLYGHRNPKNLFKAISKLKNNDYTLSFDFYGFVENTINERAGKKEIIHFHKYLPHSNIVSIYEKSDILLLYIGGYNQNSKGTLTGKLFEYLYTGIPILFIGPIDGEAAEIIRKCNAGFIVEDNEKAIYELIITIYDKWKNGDLRNIPDKSEIAKYDRKILTKRFERIIDKI